MALNARWVARITPRGRCGRSAGPNLSKAAPRRKASLGSTMSSLRFWLPTIRVISTILFQTTPAARSDLLACPGALACAREWVRKLGDDAYAKLRPAGFSWTGNVAGWQIRAPDATRLRQSPFWGLSTIRVYINNGPYRTSRCIW